MKTIRTLVCSLSILGVSGFASPYALESTALAPTSQSGNLSAQMQVEAIRASLQAVINQMLVCNAKARFFTPSASTPGRDADGCIANPPQWLNGASNALYYNAGNVGIGTSTPNDKLHVAGGLFTNGWHRINEGWSPAQELAINSNQIWKSITAGDSSLYFQWSNPGGAVVVGGQSGATNNMDVYGRLYIRDGIMFGNGSVLTTAPATSAMPTQVTVNTGDCNDMSNRVNGISSNMFVCPAGKVLVGFQQQGLTTGDKKWGGNFRCCSLRLN
ncbi:hypothetical protein KKP04_11120 [Rhodomicrobium sp. Az07]|uniref:hypothetical protein n=1 Tax=Rhodomicrobium sp. Az07 TaxID=2839034 RepID=UPI001BE95221|nr:hypothetical protein [Rhodomicrobium sp. Az07]MBT3071414.1 hypothetical protein [Rhodomicrobium sp. Az07]